MSFENPIVVYTAATNLEAHMIVELLHANNMEAQTLEDQSGVSLWIGGAITQFHKPQICVEQTEVERAAELIRDYEDKKRARAAASEDGGLIQVACEDCGKTTSFPASLDGTTQECHFCQAYIDVGALPWSDDFDEVNE